MVQVRPGDADRFVTKPDPRVRVVLIYGADSGLAAERAAAFVRSAAGDGEPERIDLDGAAVAADPGLIADEANAISMFGGARVVVVRLDPQRPIHKQVGALLDSPPASPVVLVAGDLRKTAPIRTLCEKHDAAAAIPCYADDAGAIDRLIDEELGRAGLTITDDARGALRNLLGADRAISRSEIAKLALYAAGGERVTLDDVSAVIGDAAAFAVDEAVDAMALGDTAALDRTLKRLIAAGTPGFVVAGAAQRHLDFLHRARAARDAGTPVDAIVQRARPPVFFRRQPAVKRQIGLWTRPRIERGMAVIAEAVLAGRLNAALADAIVAEAMLRIAAGTARK